jgi:N-carbamoyl-L-amino-acid hydrolase
MKLLQRINELAKIGASETGICRPSGTTEDAKARNWVIQWMMEAGMTVRLDEYQNVIGRLEGEGKPIVVGSHIDTVLTAGKFDGVLGVLAGIEAAEELNGKIKSPLEVVVFNDEEVTMSGSVGYTADKPDIKAFLELHVEQGPVLDLQNADIGVVEGIVGQRRCEVTMFGQENHAGTTPMNLRDDALVKAAKVIQYVSELATNEGNGLVATVGKLEVSPNQFSIVPGQVDFTLQVRDLDAANMAWFVNKVCNEFDLNARIVHKSEPALCSTWIQDVIEHVCDGFNLKTVRMPSRASHDAQNFTFCPMGMIFVPSVDGISHSPKEHTTDEQCYNGSLVLTEVIRKIDDFTA